RLPEPGAPRLSLLPGRAAAPARGPARRADGWRLTAVAAPRPGVDPAVGVRQARDRAGLRAPLLPHPAGEARVARGAGPARAHRPAGGGDPAPARPRIRRAGGPGDALDAHPRRRPATLARAACVAGPPPGTGAVVGTQGVPAEAPPHLHRPRPGPARRALPRDSRGDLPRVAHAL